MFSVLGLLAFCLVDLADLRGPGYKLLRDYELKTLDSRFIMRGPRKIDPRIVIVAIDQETINQYKWPFPRFLHAKLLDTLCSAGARSIGLDIFFPFKDPTAPVSVLKDMRKQMADLGFTPDDAAFAKLEDFPRKPIATRSSRSP